MRKTSLITYCCVRKFSFSTLRFNADDRSRMISRIRQLISIHQDALLYFIYTMCSYLNVPVALLQGIITVHTKLFLQYMLLLLLLRNDKGNKKISGIDISYSEEKFSKLSGNIDYFNCSILHIKVISILQKIQTKLYI